MKLLTTLLLFSTLLFTQAIPTIAMPKNSNTSTYKRVINELIKREIPHKIIPINFKNDLVHVKSELEKADVVFAVGADLTFVLKKVKLNRSKILFSGAKNIHDDLLKQSNNRWAGIYRAVSIDKLIKMNVDTIKNNTKPFLLYKEGSNLEILTKRFASIAKGIGIDLRLVTYKSPDEFIEIFKKQKEQGATSAILFPPSVALKDFPKLIKAQNSIKLPVIVQRALHVKSGAVAGAVHDYDKAVPDLVEKFLFLADKKSRGNKVGYVFPKYFLNLKSASLIGIEPNHEILRGAEIIGTIKGAANKKKEVPPLKEKFQIAVAKQSPQSIIKKYLKSLESYGIYENINLKINILECLEPACHKESVLILATGNTFLPILKANPKIPIVALTKKEEMRSLDITKRNYTGVSRIAIDKLMNIIQKLGYSKIGMVENSNYSSGKTSNTSFKKRNNTDIEIVKYSYNTQEEIESIYKRAKKEGIELMLLRPAYVPKSESDSHIEAQFRHQLPIFATNRFSYLKKTVFGVEQNLDEIFSYLAEVSHGIFKGKKPTEYPIKFVDVHLSTNLQSATKMHMKIDPKILQESKIIGWE